PSVGSGQPDQNLECLPAVVTSPLYLPGEDRPRRRFVCPALTAKLLPFAWGGGRWHACDWMQLLVELAEIGCMYFAIAALWWVLWVAVGWIMLAVKSIKHK